MNNTNTVKKAWRNPRQVKIIHVPSEVEDAQRLKRVLALLATGVERLLSEQGEESPPEFS